MNHGIRRDRIENAFWRAIDVAFLHDQKILSRCMVRITLKKTLL